jgi:hypothetical protein
MQTLESGWLRAVGDPGERDWCCKGRPEWRVFIGPLSDRGALVSSQLGWRRRVDEMASTHSEE